ncbi:MAG: sensor histidine kinase [Clostridiales bacterium]|nr:sensor histidine kinase [Clostridiales bacterium]
MNKGKQETKTKLKEKPILKALEFLKRPDLNEEEKLISVGKWVLFLLLIFFEIVIIAQHTGDWLAERQWWRIGLTVFVEASLTGVEAEKLFKVQNFSQKLVCYALDFFCVFLLVIITSSAFLVILYLLVLTEIYITTEKLVPATMIFATCIPVYVVLYAGTLFFRAEKLSIVELLASSSTAIVALTLHFLIINFLMMFYRQYLKLERTLKELDESKMELQKAYDELEEVTVLKERQRIAKDIHDTAGHSITTVIMQTEAAKLIIDENAVEAKNKIIAANLQAKNALEELRDSVHLLSGRTAKMSLKEAIELIVRESMDGTGITIRYAVEDVTVSDEIYRFLCNTLKEGVSNGLRHGKATAFWLELRKTEKDIEFLLSDNGCGADVTSLEEGLGLSGMKEQAKRLGGKLSVSTEKDEGFEIFLVLPLR